MCGEGGDEGDVVRGGFGNGVGSGGDDGGCVVSAFGGGGGKEKNHYNQF